MNPTDGGKSLDLSLAHALARIALGINIAMHGLPRLADLQTFAWHVQPQFIHTFLPSAAINLVIYGVPIGEAAIGILLILGLWLRPTLIAGLLLLYPLIFGINLIQKMDVAAEQLIYVFLYAALLATAHCDRFSVDGWCRRSRAAQVTDACR